MGSLGFGPQYLPLPTLGHLQFRASQRKGQVSWLLMGCAMINVEVSAEILNNPLFCDGQLLHCTLSPDIFYAVAGRYQ